MSILALSFVTMLAYAGDPAPAPAPAATATAPEAAPAHTCSGKLAEDGTGKVACACPADAHVAEHACNAPAMAAAEPAPAPAPEAAAPPAEDDKKKKKKKKKLEESTDNRMESEITAE